MRKTISNEKMYNYFKSHIDEVYAKNPSYRPISKEEYENANLFQKFAAHFRKRSKEQILTDLVVARSCRFIPFVFDVAGTHGAKAIFTDVQSDAAKIMTFVERIPRVRMEGIIANIRGMDTRWPNEIVRIKEGGFFLKDFFNARR